MMLKKLTPVGKRAATYARFSTNLQDEATIADQQRLCRKFADANGITIVAEFTDCGISGSALGNRPGALDLMAAAERREIDTVIIADLSRLSRTNADLPRLIKRLKFQEVRVFGAHDQFDSDAATAGMQVGFSGIASDDFIAIVSRKTHSALDLRFERGTSSGGVSYGYETDEAKVRHIVPARAAIVREIFKRVRDGETFKAICADLNRRNVASPGASWKRTERRTDGRWIVPTLNALVQNELYIGQVVWNKTKSFKEPDTGVRVQRARPVSEHRRAEMPELRIVDQETWDAVQETMQRRKGSTGPKGGRPRKYPLSGLLICGLCGARLVVSGGTKNSRGYGGGKQFYVCSSYQQGGEHACSNRYRADRRRSEDLILTQVREQVLSPAAVDEGCRKMRRLMKEAPPPAVVDASTIDAKVAKLKAAIAAGALDAEDAEPVFAKLDRDRAELQRAAQRKARGPILSGPWGLEQEFKRVAGELLEQLGSEDAAVVRAALSSVIGESIKVRPEQAPDGSWRLVAEIRSVDDASAAVVALTGSLGRSQKLSSGGGIFGYIALI